MPPRGGQIFLTRAVSDLLADEELGEQLVRDLGEVPLRRSEDAVRAYELVVPASDRAYTRRPCHADTRKDR